MSAHYLIKKKFCEDSQYCYRVYEYIPPEELVPFTTRLTLAPSLKSLLLPRTAAAAVVVVVVHSCPGLVGSQVISRSGDPLKHSTTPPVPGIVVQFNAATQSLLLLKLLKRPSGFRLNSWLLLPCTHGATSTTMAPLLLPLPGAMQERAPDGNI